MKFNSIDQRSAISQVLKERHYQDLKWGEQNHDPFLWATVLGEEYGEFCQAALKARFQGESLTRLCDEAVQVAAVAVAIIECLYRQNWEWTDQDKMNGDRPQAAEVAKAEGVATSTISREYGKVDGGKR